MTADGRAMPDGYAAEVCLDDVCRRQPWTEGGRSSIPLALPDSGTVTLVIRTFDGSGKVLAEQRVEAEIATFSPNGPDCGPNVGVVQLSRMADGTLRQVPAPGG